VIVVAPARIVVENKVTIPAAQVSTAATTSSQVTVRLPADAKLYVDGVACPQTSSERSFETPKLEPGRSYTYNLKIEMVRNGQTKAESRQVAFRAGQPVTVDFKETSVVATTVQR